MYVTPSDRSLLYKVADLDLVNLLSSSLALLASIIPAHRQSTRKVSFLGRAILWWYLSDIQALASEHFRGLFTHGTALGFPRWHHNTVLCVGIACSDTDKRYA